VSGFLPVADPSMITIQRMPLHDSVVDLYTKDLQGRGIGRWGGEHLRIQRFT
jgi:hypothetical protein